MIKVGVLGAGGRMGTSICEAVAFDERFELVAALGSSDERTQLVEAGAEVVVDVTTTAAASDNLPWLAANGMHAVVGTTGFSPEQLAEIGAAFSAAGKAFFLVPNFSIGAVLLMRFAEMATNHFDGVEIIELHHNKKKDAPSGTAQLTANRIDAARTAAWAPDPTERETVAGARGGEAAPGVRVHSVRLPGLLAHQEVIFGTTGETFTIRHDSFDRSAYMPGVLTAVASIGSLPPGMTVGLDAVLPL